MCQILKIEVGAEIEVINNQIFDHERYIKYLLDEKGGESYSFFAAPMGQYFEKGKYAKEILIYADKYDYNEQWKEFKNKVIEMANIIEDNHILFVFFSRQAPEMESEPENMKPAPYYENNTWVWMHGTVANMEEIETELDHKFDVDSKVIPYYTRLSRNDIEIKGVFTALLFQSGSLTVDWLYNGIGLWQARSTVCYSCSNKMCEYVDWEGTTANINQLIFDETIAESERLDLEPYYLIEKTITNSEEPVRKNYVAFSGGMDIVMATYLYAKKGVKFAHGNIEDETVMVGTVSLFPDTYDFHFVYFDYGARSRDHEIAAMHKFVDFLKKDSPELNITYEIIDVKLFFNEISKINNFQSKLTSDDSKADIAETESNLAYVPYRNSQFALLLGAIIDRDLEKDIFTPQIIYGLNLTEMSVYVDNTDIWRRSVQATVNYGGKNYKNVEILAPFVNTTKTNMLAYMITRFGKEKVTQLLDIAFSCYYPDEDGSACGKCGSCLLREKAIKRADIVAKRYLLEHKGK